MMQTQMRFFWPRKTTNNPPFLRLPCVVLRETPEVCLARFHFSLCSLGARPRAPQTCTLSPSQGNDFRNTAMFATHDRKTLLPGVVWRSADVHGRLSRAQSKALRFQKGCMTCAYLPHGPPHSPAFDHSKRFEHWQRPTRLVVPSPRTRLLMKSLPTLLSSSDSSFPWTRASSPLRCYETLTGSAVIVLRFTNRSCV